MTDCVLGIDFGGTKIALATADAQGKILVRDNLPTPHHADEAVKVALHAAREIIRRTEDETGCTPSRIGVATMGITREDRVDLAPNVPGWETLRLPDRLRQALAPAKVAIANDVKCAALAEVTWGALCGLDPGLFINLGTGIAAALVVGGRVVTGAHQASGEIAYNPLTPDDIQGVRDHVAPLELRVGGGPLKHRAEQELGWQLSAGDLFRRWHTDPEIRRWLEPDLKQLAYQLTHLVIALDPARVVVGGGLVAVRDVIFPYLNRYFERFVPYPPELVPAFYERDAGLMGAIALALSDS